MGREVVYSAASRHKHTQTHTRTHTHTHTHSIHRETYDVAHNLPSSHRQIFTVLSPPPEAILFVLPVAA